MQSVIPRYAKRILL